ncbi:MAG: tetratricopeptide repeat protein, partial [Acidobacteria bacterium]|nr:tetratricopeptide repeat protein [Acidobacteriota bacterium]
MSEHSKRGSAGKINGREFTFAEQVSVRDSSRRVIASNDLPVDVELKTLGGAATKLREKLGESLASIQKFDAPIEQATTSSPEALKALTLGNEMHLAGKFYEAIPFFKRAVELDPDFALAYLKLGIAHYYIFKDQLAAEYAERAFELRGRTSEREKFYISNSYYALTGEIDKSIEVLELWKQTYPRDITPRSDLSGQYAYTGQYDKA